MSTRRRKRKRKKTSSKDLQAVIWKVSGVRDVDDVIERMNSSSGELIKIFDSENLLDDKVFFFS